MWKALIYAWVHRNVVQPFLQLSTTLLGSYYNFSSFFKIFGNVITLIKREIFYFLEVNAAKRAINIKLRNVNHNFGQSFSYFGITIHVLSLMMNVLWNVNHNYGQSCWYLCATVNICFLVIDFLWNVNHNMKQYGLTFCIPIYIVVN